MNDLLLTEENDLLISESGDIVFTDSISQAIKIRLKWFLGEWKINQGYGIPYYQEVFIKNPSTALLEDRLRTEILTVSGVNTVDNIVIKLDKAERKAKITFSVNSGTETGEVTLNV